MSDYRDEFRAYAVHLTAEHRRLSVLLRQIDEQFAQPARPALAESLKQLRAELLAHFEEEESGGCLEEAIAHFPRLTADANQVLSEHSNLLAELDRVIEQIELPNGSTPFSDLHQRFQQFAEQLRTHEAAENRILQESFGVDVR